jgi:hypothetical protein
MLEKRMNRSIHLLAGMIIVLAALCVTSVGRAQALADRERIPVLAELFTSEGCSSCPPADKILEWLSKEQPVDGVYVVTMSEHVTYWDHQGWKDPFGSPRFTQRQQMYGVRLGVADIFTPQLVIDGMTQLVGSDTAALKSALTDAARKPKPRLTVESSLTADGSLSGSASGPGLDAGAAEGAELLWAVTEDDLAVDVSRGENTKRTLRHSGVVRVLIDKKITRANATPVSVITRLPTEWNRANLRLVAFVQSTKTRRVLSVGWTRVLSARPANSIGM